ncbi:MAG: cell division protein SepF [Aquiluna sp.]|nr:cell division protein SepF [Aquiluna sp.]MCF8544966.1 cell division protein SepF [Aquiluna sp.]
MGVFKSVMTFFGFGDSEPSKQESAAKPRAAATRPRRSGDLSEIITLDPQSYADCREVAAKFRMNVPVIVNIGAMSEPDAKRMLDFMLGLKDGLEGNLRRVTPKVFLLSPANVSVNDSEESEDESEDLMR